MGVAYFIVLDNPNPGFDTFVNGKCIAREGGRLDRLTRSLGLQEINELVSASPETFASLAEDFGIDEPIDPPPEQWFHPDEGLAWIATLRSHLQKQPASLRDSEGVLGDLSEYQGVLERAKAINARWHFALDF